MSGSQGRKSFVVSVESKKLYMDEINCHHLAERFSRANFSHYCLYDMEVSFDLKKGERIGECLLYSLTSSDNLNKKLVRHNES